MEIKEYPFITFRSEKGGKIIFAQYPKNLRMELSMAKEIVANRIEFTQNKKHYLVLDACNIKEVTPKAKWYMQQPDGGLKNILGAAFIANNPVAELIANVFVKTPKDFEAAFFHKEEDAVRWIKKCIQRRSLLKPIDD
jgi:hypothetical protein